MPFHLDFIMIGNVYSAKKIDPNGKRPLRNLYIAQGCGLPTFTFMFSLKYPEQR